MMREKFLAFLGLIVIFTAFSVFPAEVNGQSRRDQNRARKIAGDGDALFNKKDYRGAINKYAEAISIYPNFPEAHFWKGYAHYYLNEFDSAINELNLAHTQGFKPIDVYKLRWYLNFNRGNYDAALKDAQAGLNLEPENNYYMLALGDIYRAQKNYRNAFLAYKRALEKDPNNADAHYFVAEASFNLGEKAEQETAAREAIRGGTKYPGEAWFYLAEALQDAKKTDEAIEAYKRAIIANQKLYGAYNNLSEIYRSQGRLIDAIDVMEKAEKQFPDDGTVFVNLSWYYSLAEKHNDAVRAGQKATQLSPENYMAHTNLCRAYNDTKLYTQAIKTCEEALRLQPGDGETYFYLARAHDLMNKPQEATPYYKKAVVGLVEFTNSNPDYADGFYLLGNAYYADNQRDKAIEAYQKTLELSPRFSRARYNLGYLLFLKNDMRGAQEQVSALMTIDQNLANKLKQAIQK